MTALVIAVNVVLCAVLIVCRRLAAPGEPLTPFNRAGLAVLGVGVFAFDIAGFTAALPDSAFRLTLVVSSMAMAAGGIIFLAPTGGGPVAALPVRLAEVIVVDTDGQIIAHPDAAHLDDAEYAAQVAETVAQLRAGVR